ncbi:autotransporter outer membrane beta-barrel domain-containing protein [Bartonella heixiaziensis]|uniref:autotransporter outer membrane beta-barrel domain-containing protein n=1 Tax=Bartonella heixiaziensis TaxID=1461000 RepID=UPI003908A126
MKKSFLLYTVSGVLFCSYPLNANTLQLPSKDSSLEKHSLDNSKAEKRVRRTNPRSKEPVKLMVSEGNSEKPKAGNTLPETLTTRDTVSASKPELQLSRMSAQSLTTQTESTEDVQLRPTEPKAIRNGVEDSTTDTTKIKSRKRPSVNSSPMSSTAEESPSRPRISTQPTSAEPAPLILPAPEKPAAAVEAAPQQPEEQVKIEDMNSALEVQNGETVTRHNVKIHDKFVAIDAQEENSTVKIIKGTVSSGFIALNASNGGSIHATDINVTTPSVGLVNMRGTISLKDSTVNVTGDYGGYGIVFRGIYTIPEEQDAHNGEDGSDKVQEKSIVSKVMLTNTKLFVKNGIGIGIYGITVNGEVNLKDSEIHADILMENKKTVEAPPHTFTLNGDHSVLEGRVNTRKDNRTIFNLSNNSTWLLPFSKEAEDNDQDPSDYELFDVDEKSYSKLSALSLTNSSVVFDKPMAGHYQTLFIGSKPQQEVKTPNTPVAYSATGNAEFHLNTKWSSNSPVQEQETDRVVIDGDVSGSTVVHINLLEKNQKITDSSSVWGEHMASLPLETHGISVIQVSGKANENSFKLAEKYMTMGGLPYKYILTAYAPGTSHANQNLFGKNDKNFWDFRLQNAYVDREKKIRAILPQVANYLVMPNALFSAGFSDVNNQNALLENIHTKVFGAEKSKKQSVFFSSYSEKVTLFSNRDPLRYGYDADVNYNALQLGVVLAALEGKDISTHFGLLGTYGKLAFTPKEMEDSEKTTLDKWSLTAYSGIQHSSGLYVNTLISYGKLNGNITTALIGNAAKLDGTETLSASAIVGQKLATSIEGLMFEPQAQLVYQNLLFDVLSDADGFEVDMNNPHQWLVRIGGRLTKNLSSTEENKAVSFYGKLNVLKTFGDGGTIKIGDTFYRDPTGSSIEGGIGVNAHLSRNIALHGDMSYRKKLQKAGVSGTSFSGGIRYRF